MKNYYKQFLIIFFIHLNYFSDAQDIIIKKNGDEIQSKILDADSGKIKYKRFDNVDGPTYILPKEQVFIIKYADGTKVIVSRIEAPESHVPKKEPLNEKKIFREKKTYISLGYGFGAFTTNGSSWNLGSGNYYSNNNYSALYFTGPVYVKYEYALTEDFGIGINLAYLEYKYEETYSGYDNSTGQYALYTRTYTYTSVSGLIRANWHFGNSEKVDPYFGFGVGYRSGEWKYADTNPQTSIYNNYNGNSPFGLETTFGFRIKFSEHIGAYTEAGIAKSAIQFGLTFKF